MIWWILLALIASHFRERFNDRGLTWMNRIAAIAIATFGLITMAMAVK